MISIHYQQKLNVPVPCYPRSQPNLLGFHISCLGLSLPLDCPPRMAQCQFRFIVIRLANKLA